MPRRRARPEVSTGAAVAQAGRLDHVAHRVKAGGLADEEANGSKGTAGEDLSAVRAVAELDPLALGREDHDMLAGDRAAADRRVANGARFAGMRMLADTVEPAQFLERGTAAFGCGLAEHQRGSRRRIHLVAVMHFKNFDVPVGPQAAGRFLDQLAKQVDAERCVRCVDDGDLLRRCLDFRVMLRLQPGGPDEQRDVRRNCPLKARIERGGSGKIHQYVGMVLVDRECPIVSDCVRDRAAHSSVGRDEADAGRLVGGAHAPVHGESRSAAQSHGRSHLSVSPDLLLQQHVALDMAEALAGHAGMTISRRAAPEAPAPRRARGLSRR